MHKVIVFELPAGVVAEGNSDLKRIDGDYVRVGGQLRHAHYVIKDTPEARVFIQDTCKEMKRLEDERISLFFKALNYITLNFRGK